MCYNTTTQCCADSATSRVGDSFNGGCYAGSYCRLDYKLSTGTVVSIVGELLSFPIVAGSSNAQPLPKFQCGTTTHACWVPHSLPVNELPCAGKKCPSSSTPDICRECCADSDCPNVAIGQK